MQIKLPHATAPIKAARPDLIVIPKLYAMTLIFLVAVQLISFPDFVSYIAGYVGSHITSFTVFTAALLVGLEICATAFLLRLRLSPLARLCSAVCGLLVPLAWAELSAIQQPIYSVYMLANILFAVWAIACFWILGGRKAVQFK